MAYLGPIILSVSRCSWEESSSYFTHMVASGIQFSWAIGLIPQVLTRTCWQEGPSVLCHVDLSTELPSTQQLASSEQADKRAGRDEGMKRRRRD